MTLLRALLVGAYLSVRAVYRTGVLLLGLGVLGIYMLGDLYRRVRR